MNLLRSYQLNKTAVGQRAPLFTVFFVAHAVWARGVLLSVEMMQFLEKWIYFRGECGRLWRIFYFVKQRWAMKNITKSVLVFAFFFITTSISTSLFAASESPINAFLSKVLSDCHKNKQALASYADIDQGFGASSEYAKAMTQFNEVKESTEFIRKTLNDDSADDITVFDALIRLNRLQGPYPDDAALIQKTLVERTEKSETLKKMLEALVGRILLAR